MERMIFEQLMQTFVARVQRDRLADYEKGYPNSKYPEFAVKYATVTTVPGRKYIKVNCDTSGKFMVEIETGIIYGIKGYGKVHKGHKYGTLWNIGLRYWGCYTPRERVKTDPPVLEGVRP